MRDVRALYYKHFGDRRKERQLWATGSFFLTFAGVRGITHAIRAERGPFKNITPGGRHIHHMTFGIAGLLTVGYLWMLEIGISEERSSSRITAAAYGCGAAQPRRPLLGQAGPREHRRGGAVRVAARAQRAQQGLRQGAPTGAALARRHRCSPARTDLTRTVAPLRS
jgi:hypothetical protein